MSTPGSVTGLFAELQGGNATAAQGLWERYYTRLIDLARTRLRNAPRALADEEDIALSAFDTFCRDASEGRFPQIRDRDDLWKVLLRITACKVTDHIRHETRQKRSGEQEQVSWEQIIGSEPTPEFAASVAEEYERLLALLGDESLRTVATLKMEGYTAAEIAERLGCSERTVERKLRVIRSIWPTEQEGAP